MRKLAPVELQVMHQSLQGPCARVPCSVHARKKESGHLWKHCLVVQIFPCVGLCDAHQQLCKAAGYKLACLHMRQYLRHNGLLSKKSMSEYLQNQVALATSSAKELVIAMLLD